LGISSPWQVSLWTVIHEALHRGWRFINRVSHYLLPFRTLPSPPLDQPEGSTTRARLAVGAGIEFKLPIMRITPGIRFSHWNDQLFVPSTNTADFLIGVSF
jgi:hypothetical protein